MYPVPALDVGESVIFGSHAQDGWDSFLDILWQLEQQESTLTRQPEQKELSFIEAQPSNAIFQPSDYSAGSQVTTTDRQTDETQRRLHNRRTAQKRFRERQKEQKCNVETELRQTQRELQQSKTQQAAMQAELAVLKRSAHNIPNSQLTALQQNELAYTGDETAHPANGLPPDLTRLIRCSVLSVASGNQACCTPAADEGFSPAEVEKLYQATVHKLAKTLKTYDDASAHEPSQLCELSTQACSLLLHQVSSNMPGLIMRSRVNQEDLIPVSYATKKSALLEALSYSPGQIADLLTVRQLFFTKLGHLRDARGTALDALAKCSGDLHTTKIHTDQMKALVEETYHTYLQFGVACHFGIHTSRQLAVGIVHSFPRNFGSDLLEALGERHGAPALQSLMSLCIPELVEVTWDDVKIYLQSITCNTLQHYIPFLRDNTPR